MKTIPQIPQLNVTQKGLNLRQFGPIQLVVIQSDSFCNLDCDYCYLPNRHVKHRLSVDLIAPIFEKILTSPFIGKSFTVCWHLGEPLAVPISFYEEALEIIDEVKTHLNNDVIINYAVQSNGLFLSQAWCNFGMVQIRVTKQTSIDGLKIESLIQDMSDDKNYS